MKPDQMSINKLVIHSELAVLGFVLIVLLLSTLDRGGSKGALAPGRTEQRVGQNENKKAEAVRTELFTDVHVSPRQRETWFGDLDDMLKRGQLRVLIPFSRTFFFRANSHELGLSSETLRLYEQFLNDQMVLGDKKMKFIFLPTPKKLLIEDLLAGKGDIVVADIFLPPEQKKLVKFVSPVAMEIQEILATGPNSPKFKSIFNLSGQEITVRENSSYAASLQKLNSTLTSIGRKPVTLHFAEALLEDEDLLEMTAAGLLPMTVVDSHVGAFWATVFPRLKLHNKIALRTAKEISWAVRPDTPLLQESISSFKKNSYLPCDGHISLTGYYRNKDSFLKNSLSLPALERYHSTVALLKKYGEKYTVPYLLLAALAYQESKLDPFWLGENGEVGLMGIDPSAVLQEGLETDLQRVRKPEHNIHTAVRYLRFLADRYFFSPRLSELDRNLMAIAAYKSSPEQVIAARKKAALAGYNPDIWFNHVETTMHSGEGENIKDMKDIAQYVRNIYKYLKAYEYFFDRTENEEQE
ncbi:MAG: lytic transglycosylase F [Candidatus Electrothrix sp. GM3_4]|nr:lytic transglycosylase F [Candidatus Electrothrix sp. GM3_4]